MQISDILVELLAIKLYEHDAQDHRWPSNSLTSWRSIPENDRQAYREMVADAERPVDLY